MAATRHRRALVAFLTAFGENVALALDSMRVRKMRAALTILGVVIGVATVMAMASIVQGIRDQIVSTLEIAGPTTFYVVKVFSQTPMDPRNLPKWVRIRPDLSEAEADRIRALPEIAYAAIWGSTLARVEYEGERTNNGTIVGADEGYTNVYGGDLVQGRWFTRAEEASGAPVAVLMADAASKVFGNIPPLDKWVRIGGRPARVVGIYQPAPNIFQPPGQQTHAIVPFRMLDHQFTFDHTNALVIPVKPRAGITVADAESEVTVALRVMRGLHPADGNTFDLITQDQILDTFNNLTRVFFLVMIVLSAVALLVGGIGVMAVMMISVTERTREIGIRKALGATRRDIMQQFLTEAAALTGTGGMIGIVCGLGLGRLAQAAMSIDARPPVNLTLLAVGVSVAIGLIFGLLPARRAARLDPIEALRYE